MRESSWTSLVVQWLRSCLPRQGTGFNPWSGKIPHAAGQLSTYGRTPEPIRRKHSAHALQTPHAAATRSRTPDPTCRSHSADALQTPHAAATQPMHSRPHTPQLLTHALQTPHAAATRPMHCRPYTLQPLSRCTLDPTRHNH